MTTEVRQANVDDQGNFKVDLPTSGARLAAVLDNVEATLNTNDATNKLLAANLARHIQAKILDEAKPVAISDTRTMLKLQHLIAISEPLELSARINGTISGVQNFSKSAYQSVDAIVAEGLHLATDYQKDPIHTLSAVTKDVKHFINSIDVRDTLDAINGWGKADNARRASILGIDDPQQRVFAQNERDAEILSNGLTVATGLSGAAKIGGNLARKIATKFDDLPFDGVLVTEGVGIVEAKSAVAATTASKSAIPFSLGAVAITGNQTQGNEDIEKDVYYDHYGDEFAKSSKRTPEGSLIVLDDLSEARVILRREEIKSLVVEGNFNFNMDRFEKFNIKEVLTDREIAGLEKKLGAEKLPDANPSIDVTQQFRKNLEKVVNPDPRILPDKQAIHGIWELLDTRTNYITADTKKLIGLLTDELNDYSNFTRGNFSSEAIPKNSYFGSDRNRLFSGGATVDFSSNIESPEL